MYAVIATGGKQYRVKAGDLLHVEKLDLSSQGGAKGSITFDQVLMLGEGDAIKIGAPTVAGAKVVAEVLTYTDKGAEEQGRPSTARSRNLGPKLIVYKYRRRKGYRRRNGHRQAFTALKITSVSA